MEKVKTQTVILWLGLMALLVSASVLADTPAGEIIIASGEVIAIHPDNTTRPLRRK